MYSRLFRLFVTIPCLLMAFSTAFAQDDARSNQTAKERITIKIAEVEAYVGQIDFGRSIEDRISLLDYSGIREKLTELQNLIRVYEEMKCCKHFKSLYEEAKAFEDLISHVRDYKYFYQASLDKDEATQAKFKKILDDEILKYGQFFENSPWFKSGDDSFKSKAVKAIDQVQWPSAEIERDMALNVLAKRLQKVQDKVYDLNEVELGIHELKRDLRRFAYLRRGYTNLVTEDYNSCPLPEENSELKNPVIDPNRYTCQVSGCLTQKLSNASSELDSIKMSGLEYELRGEKAPQWVHDKAQVVHDNIKNPKILILISQQLKSCMKNDVDPKKIILTPESIIDETKGGQND